MATEWHVSRNGKTKGPFSSSQLKALADSGKLLPSDLLWKEGMKEPAPASSLKGLFAAASASVPGAEAIHAPSSEVPIQIPENGPPASAAGPTPPVDGTEPPHTPKASAILFARLRSAISSFGKTSANAGRLALLEAEKTKILNVDLPPLYAEFGRYLFEQVGDTQHRHTALFTKVQGLRRSAEEPSTADEPHGSPSGIAGRLAAATQQAKAAAATKVKQVQLFQSYTELGQAAFADYAADPSCVQAAAAIANRRNRLGDIDAALIGIDRSIGSSGITPRRLAVVGAGMIVVLTCFWLSGGRLWSSKDTTERERSASKTTAMGSEANARSDSGSQMASQHKQASEMTTREFIAKMEALASPGSSPQRKTFTFHSKTLFVGNLGDPDKSFGERVPGRINKFLWAYRCKDGTVILEVEISLAFRVTGYTVR